MNRLLVPYCALVAATLFLASCVDPEEQANAHHPGKKPGFNSTTHTVPNDVPPEQPVTDTPRETDHHATHQDPDPNPAPVKPGPAPTTGDFQYGKTVPGKPGFVTSPYAPYQGYVDVRGYAPGTEVKDPYTGKTFLVPAQ